MISHWKTMKTLPKTKASAAPKSSQRTTKKTASQNGAESNGISSTSQENVTTTQSVPQEDAIAQRAYHIWLENGCENGREEQHWQQAQRELSNQVPD